MNQDIQTLAEWIQSSKHTVVLTGAGMSTESGVPDFRSRSGWWKSIDPRTVATVEALETNYDLFHEFYSMRIRSLSDISPHAGHDILAKWEKQNMLYSVATQNVDRLHQKSGSENVFELHGNIEKIRCNRCGISASQEEFLNKSKCKSCGGDLRPNVVLFGEMLPEDAWDSSLHQIQRAEIVIVIGTSLEVYPVNQLPSMTKGHTVIINYDDVHTNIHFDLIIKGKAKEILEKVDQLIN